MIRCVSRRLLLTAAACGSLIALVPGATATGAGPIWLPMTPTTRVAFSQQQPAMATYRNHAYVLTTRSNPNSGATLGVYLTSNESGAWTTRLLSAHGPDGLVQNYATAIAIDPATRRLYAVWVRSTAPGRQTVGVWMRDASGAWSGPTDVATSSQFTGPPSAVAAGGKAYVAFTSQMSGPCDDSKSLRADVLVASYDGTAWARPQNLTSCVAGLPAGANFWAPKLALDDSGHLYVAAANDAALKWDVWYLDNVSGAWSQPLRLTHGRDDDRYHFSFAIAASKGIAYVAYTQALRPSHIGYHEIVLATHPHGGAWSAGRVTQDPQNCDKHDVALVARAGRLGLAYILDGTSCGGNGAIYNVPHALTGTPGHWSEAALGLAPNTMCKTPTLSSDGDLFRLVVACHKGVEGADNLLYKPEFLDVVGPATTIGTLPAHATAPSITLSWSAQDRTPGSGVADYAVQVRENGGPWQVVVAATRSTSLIYTHAQAGHTYTFRVRARDKVNNWGPWAVSGTVQAS